MLRTVSSTGGASIVYEDQGQGTPILFVHAFPLNRNMWQPQMQEFQGFRRIAMDLRGFGQSSSPQELCSIADLAQDVLSVALDCQVELAHFVGCSMGGYILMELLKQKPDMVLSLSLLDTRVAADTPEAKQNRLDLIERLQQGGPEARQAFQNQMLDRLLAAQNKNGELAQKVTSMMQMASTNGITAALLAIANRQDSVLALKGFQGPAMVAVGTEDPIVSIQETQEMASLLPRGKFVVVPKAGHLPSLEHPELLQKEFLSVWEQTC